MSTTLAPVASAAGVRATVEIDLAELEDSLFERLLAKLDTPDQKWLSVNGAATYMDSSPAAVRQLIRRGYLRSYRPDGGSIRLCRLEIDEWIRGEA